MKALTLFLLRLSTGMLMVWWGLGRAVFRNGSDGGKNVGEALSEAYYKGIANDGNIQIMLGWAEVALDCASWFTLYKSLFWALVLFSSGIIFSTHMGFSFLKKENALTFYSSLPQQSSLQP